MANGWQNTVPLGQAGTGAAYILPQSNAADNFAANMRQLNQQRQIQQQRAIQEARELAKSYQDNMLTGSSGRLWANEIGKLEQDHIRQGMEYRAQGFDIYNPDPNDPRQMEAHSQYMQDRARLESLREYRKGLETQYNETQKALQKANIGEYNMRDIQKLHDFVTGTSIMELYEQNAQLPNVGRRFNPQQYLPKSAAVTSDTTFGNNLRTKVDAIDEPTTQRSIIGSIANAPGGAEFLNELTGGIDPMTLVNLPDDRDAIRDQILRDYQGDPQLREALATSPTPVLPDTPALDQWIDQQADGLYQAKRRFQPQFDNWMGQVTGGVKTGVTETPDYSANREARQAEQRAEQRTRFRERGESGSGTEYSLNVGDQVIPVGYGDTSGEVTATNVINIGQPTVTMTGSSEAVSLDTGGKISTETSVDGRVVNVGNYLIDRNGNAVRDGQSPAGATRKKMALIRTSDGENILMPADKLPAFLPKERREAVQNWLRAGSDTQQPSSGTAQQDDRTPEQIAEDLINKYSQ